MFCSDVMTDCLKIDEIVEIVDVAGPRAVPRELFTSGDCSGSRRFERCDIFSFLDFVFQNRSISDMQMMQAQTISSKPSCSVEHFQGAYIMLDVMCIMKYSKGETQGELRLAVIRWACGIQRNHI